MYKHVHIKIHIHTPQTSSHHPNTILQYLHSPLPSPPPPPTHHPLSAPDSKVNGDAAANAAALANEDCPTIDQVLGDERSPATGGLGSTASRERYPHDRACFLLSAGEFQRTTDGNVRKGRRAGAGRSEGEGGASRGEGGRGLSYSSGPSPNAWP